MAIDIKEIKRLKELTGVGITDAKKALEASKGDFDKALEAMRIKGMAKADKKSDREAREGIVHAYVHSDRIGVLVEVNCETDFVARTDQFQEFVHDIALHIAASAPLFISIDEIDKASSDKETDLIKQELAESGKPKDMIDKILTGKLDKWHKEVALLEQPYIKNLDITVGEYLKETSAKLGEKIVVSQIHRMELGARS